MPKKTFELDPEDMAVPRRPKELASWVAERCEVLGMSLEAKSYARSGDPLPKKFYEEVRPLAIYAEAMYEDFDDVMVIPNLGNENYDGTVILPDGKKIFVEITSAKDGYSDSLRMEMLQKDGRVNAIGPVTVSGKRRSVERKINVSDDAVDHNHLVGEHLALVAIRMCAKANPKYGPDHVLLVAVDDYIAFRAEPDINRLRGLVSVLVRTLPLEFQAVAMVGQSDRVLFEIEVPKGTSKNAL